MANGLVVRLGGDPSVYALERAHHATPALVELAAVLPEPEHAMGVVARANRAVEFAVADRYGVVLVLAPDADPSAIALLHSVIGMVATGHPRAHPILPVPSNELDGLVDADRGFWTRLREGVRIKGQLPTLRPAAGS